MHSEAASSMMSYKKVNVRVMYAGIKASPFDFSILFPTADATRKKTKHSMRKCRILYGTALAGDHAGGR